MDRRKTKNAAMRIRILLYTFLRPPEEKYRLSELAEVGECTNFAAFKALHLYQKKGVWSVDMGVDDRGRYLTINYPPENEMNEAQKDFHERLMLCRDLIERMLFDPIAKSEVMEAVDEVSLAMSAYIPTVWIIAFGDVNVQALYNNSGAASFNNFIVVTGAKRILVKCRKSSKGALSGLTAPLTRPCNDSWTVAPMLK